MRLFVRALFVFFLIALASSAFAEDDLLFSPDYSGLRSQAMVSGEKITWEPTFKSVEPISFKISALLPSNNREALRASAVSQTSALGQAATVPSTVSFVVGFDTLTAELDHVEYGPTGAYSWFGMVPGALTLSHFTVIGDAVAGNVWGPDGLTRTIIARGGETFLVEMDDREVSSLLSRCEVREDRESLEMENFGVQRLSPVRAVAPVPEPHTVGPCEYGQTLMNVVDVLYVYDKTTLEWFKGDVNAVVAFAQNAINDFNVTLKNSSVPGHVNLVHVDGVNYASAGHLSEDHGYLGSAEVTSLREKYKPDIVGLFVSPPNPDLGGVAGGYRPTAEWGSHVTHMWGGCVSSRHELGHNFGPNHQREYAFPPEYNYSAYAYGRWKNWVFRDAMSYEDSCPNGCPTNPPIFSTPRVTLPDGFVVGVEGESDNARAIRETFASVANRQTGSGPVCK